MMFPCEMMFSPPRALGYRLLERMGLREKLLAAAAAHAALKPKPAWMVESPQLSSPANRPHHDRQAR